MIELGISPIVILSKKSNRITAVPYGSGHKVYKLPDSELSLRCIILNFVPESRESIYYMAAAIKLLVN